MSIVIGYLGPGADRHPAMDKRRRPPPSVPEGDYAPAALQEAVSLGEVRSEQQRAEVAALNQAMQGAEGALALVEHTLRSVERIAALTVTLQDAVTASLAASAGETLERRKADIRDLLRQIDQAARRARFGDQYLLNGDLGVTGEARGEGLRFVSGSDRVRSSPAEGYPVLVSRAPRRARLVGQRALEPPLLRQPLRLRVREGPREIQVETRGGESLDELLALLAGEIRRGQLELAIQPRRDGRLELRHARYGAEASFQAESSVPGILSWPDGRPGRSRPGADVVGTLNGEPAAGRGEYLVGLPDNRTTAGLVVAFTGQLPPVAGPERADGSDPPPAPVEVGRVVVAQQGLNIRLSAGHEDAAVLALPSLEPVCLGRQVFNHSGFGALAEIQVDSVREARDALKVAQRAVLEVRQVHERVHQLRQQRLLPQLTELRERARGLGAGLDAIGDSGFARGLAAHVSACLWHEQGLAMQAQPNLVPGTVMRLIN